MTRLILILVLSLSAVSPAAAQTLGTVEAVQPAPPLRFALGLSADLQNRADFGEGTHFALVPGIVGFLYLPLPMERFYLRPGARFSFTGLDPVEMPNGLQIDEWDMTLGGEVGLVYDGPVVPAVSVGVEGVTRVIKTSSKDLISGGNDKDVEFLPGIYGQIALGIPIAGGRVMLEPFWRYEHVFDDPRIKWRTGVDATFLVF